MTMNERKAKQLNLRKATRFAVILNALQVATMLAVIAYVVRRGGEDSVELGVLLLGLVIVALGAALDIREAVNAQRIARQTAMLEDAYRQLEDLNATLRRQRHDFTNHLQVVFSLMELGDDAEAMRYVESVYADIRRAGSALKTAIPAVNALIAAKRADCEERGIAFQTDIRSAWQDMPVPGWELCRVLGNLIDNARDALTGAATPSPAIAIRFDETPAQFSFRVSNNGPAIPPDQLEHIFRMGFTTKREGSGYGLAIVREILETHGGTIEVTSDDRETAFTGVLSKDEMRN